MSHTAFIVVALGAVLTIGVVLTMLACVLGTPTVAKRVTMAIEGPEHPKHECSYSSGAYYPEPCVTCGVLIKHRYCTVCGDKNKIVRVGFDGQNGKPVYQGVCPTHGVTS